MCKLRIASNTIDAARAVGIEQGIEDITTDAFADNYVKRLRLDPKALEKDIGDYVHQMPEDF